MSPLFCPDLLPLNNRHRKDKIRQSEKSIRANIPKRLIKKTGTQHPATVCLYASVRLANDSER